MKSVTTHFFYISDITNSRTSLSKLCCLKGKRVSVMCPLYGWQLKLLKTYWRQIVLHGLQPFWGSIYQFLEHHFKMLKVSHLMATILKILVSNTQLSVALATSWWQFWTVLSLYIHVNFYCVYSPSKLASGTSALQTPKCTNNAMEPMMLSVIQQQQRLQLNLTNLKEKRDLEISKK